MIKINRLKPLNIFILNSFILICIEIMFKFLNLQPFTTYLITITILFSCFFSLVITFITYLFPNKMAYFINLIIILFVILYSIGQLGLYFYIGVYFNFKTLFSIGTKLNEFGNDFFQSLNTAYLILVMPLLVFILFYRKLNSKLVIFKVKHLTYIFIFTILIHFSSISLITNFDNTNYGLSVIDLYKQPVFTEKAIKILGVTKFITRDILFSVNNNENSIGDISYFFDGKITKENNDDFITLTTKKVNNPLLQIEEKLLNRKIKVDNEFTGILQNNNLILILVESFDYAAINKNLTPTLYKMLSEGWLFDNYYTPRSICSTGGSEFMAITSLLYTQDSCVYNDYANNDFSTSLFHLFNSSGYTSTSYHNFWDKYYDRNIMHKSLGSSKFYDANELGIDYENKWPSDMEFIDLSFEKFNDEPFFSFLISVSMHTPYEANDAYVIENLEIVNLYYPNIDEELKVYLSKAMEFDNAMAMLIEKLKESNQFDSTNIILFSDHQPPKFSDNLLIENTTIINRFDYLDISKTPLIIYGAKLSSDRISNLGSTIDLLPTISNLFGLKYDSRLYLGNDILDKNSKKFVYFSNGDWIIQEGKYLSGTSEFIPTKGIESFDIKEISKINLHYINYFKLNKLILDLDYFKKRDDSSNKQ